MQVRCGVEMLAVLVLVVLVPGTVGGQVLDKCQLGHQLNQTLNASLLDHLTSVAQIVCQVNLTSGFNTSAVLKISVPDGHDGRGRRRSRSTLDSSSEESSEEDAGMPNLIFNSFADSNVTRQHGNTSFPKNGQHSRHPRSVEGSGSMESSEDDDSNSAYVGSSSLEHGSVSSTKRGRRSRHARSVPSENSSEVAIRPPRPSSSSSTVKPTSTPKPTVFGSRTLGVRKVRAARKVRVLISAESDEDNTDLLNVTTTSHQNHSSSEVGGRGHRRGRSLKDSSSEGSDENDFIKPKSSLSPATVTPPTSPQSNASRRVEVRRRIRSAHASSMESDEEEVWTLYGLFQLPDHIACTSGNRESYNLCKMSCDMLINNDITDDIACVRTILSKIKSLQTGKDSGAIGTDIKKLANLLYKKECASVVDSSYFYGC